MAKGQQPPKPTTTTTNPVEDTNSPYYLHNADHPGLVLVTHLLTGTNYHTWNRAMSMALTAKNKYQFVDGSLPQPDSDDLLSSFWIRCNSMVTSWLLNSIAREIADSLLYIPTAAGIWMDLKERFQQGNGPRIFQLKSQITTLTQGALDVNTYYTRLKTLWDELKEFEPMPSCTCGGLKAWTLYREHERSLQFLMGLNDSFSSTRAQILLMEPLPSLGRVFSLVVQEERQRNIHSHHSVGYPSSVPTVNATQMPGKPRRPFCTHCSMTGHTIEKCFHLHGYPPGFKGRMKNNPGQGNTGFNSGHNSTAYVSADAPSTASHFRHAFSST
ncbi:uncharacterized protein LOC133311079 [Gastrolobium bilobum]|uniref:uncharacterized protein LOC133311079 n=1 Tax=Gastrolobium bilobum TaxID=150636 RepID=UPI002AB2CE57|nr:uncharacterized protein LOC133311079 [Gastrolobium bilobum]